MFSINEQLTKYTLQIISGGNTMASIMPLIVILFYIFPVLFIIWFLIRFLQTQNERNSILKEISRKLDVIITNEKEV